MISDAFSGTDQCLTFVGEVFDESGERFAAEQPNELENADRIGGGRIVAILFADQCHQRVDHCCSKGIWD